MKVEVLYRNDPERPLTDPVVEKDGRKFVFRLYRGSICDPILGTLFGYKWFEEPYPKYVLKVNSKIPLPFISFKWPFLNRGCYLGWKVYGVDSEAYKNWIDPTEVYNGSQAMCLTIRPFANLGN